MPSLSRGRIAAGLIVVIVGLLELGCAPAIRTRHEFPPSTTATQLAGVKATPELQSLVTELAREGSKGAVEGMTGDDAKRQINGLVAEVVRLFFAEVRSTFQGSEGGVRELARDATSASIEAASEQMVRSFGPALRVVLIDFLREPEFRKVLGETSREIGKQAVLGTKEALAEDDGRSPKGSVLGTLQLFSNGTSIIVVLLVIVVFGLPMVWLLRERAAIRRQQDEAARRTAVVRALLESADADDDPRLKKLLRHVARHLAEDGDETEAPSPRRRVRHA